MPTPAEFKTELETHRPWGGWYGHYERSPKALIVPRLTFLRRRPARASLPGMSKMQSEVIATFTSGERDYIRGQLDRFFSTLPTVADGFQLKTWRGGPQAGKPKLRPIAKGLVERGFMRLDAEERLPRLFFTETGLAMLRAMMADRRFADPEKFAHVRQELGIDAASEGDPPQE